MAMEIIITIIITEDNKNKIINDWLKNDNYNFYFNNTKITKDIQIQNLKIGDILIKKD